MKRYGFHVTLAQSPLVEESVGVYADSIDSAKQQLRDHFQSCYQLDIASMHVVHTFNVDVPVH